VRNQAWHAGQLACSDAPACAAPPPRRRYYITLDLFVADVRRISSNCRYYNSPDTEYYKAAHRLEQQLRQHLNTFAQGWPGNLCWE
jgi:hypothetical protein